MARSSNMNNSGMPQEPEAIKNMIQHMTNFTRASTDLVKQMNLRLGGNKNKTNYLKDKLDHNATFTNPKQLFGCSGHKCCTTNACSPCNYNEDTETVNAALEKYKKSKHYKPPESPDQCICPEFRKYYYKIIHRDDEECSCIEELDEDDDDEVNEEEGCGCDANDNSAGANVEKRLEEVKKKMQVYQRKAKKYRKEYKTLMASQEEDEETNNSKYKLNQHKLQRLGQRLIGDTGDGQECDPDCEGPETCGVPPEDDEECDPDCEGPETCGMPPEDDEDCDPDCEGPETCGMPDDIDDEDDDGCDPNCEGPEMCGMSGNMNTSYYGGDAGYDNGPFYNSYGNRGFGNMSSIQGPQYGFQDRSFYGPPGMQRNYTQQSYSQPNYGYQEEDEEEDEEEEDDDCPC